MVAAFFVAWLCVRYFEFDAKLAYLGAAILVIYLIFFEDDSRAKDQPTR